MSIAFIKAFHYEARLSRHNLAILGLITLHRKRRGLSVPIEIGWMVVIILLLIDSADGPQIGLETNSHGFDLLWWNLWVLRHYLLTGPYPGFCREVVQESKQRCTGKGGVCAPHFRRHRKGAKMKPEGRPGPHWPLINKALSDDMRSLEYLRQLLSVDPPYLMVKCWLHRLDIWRFSIK